MVILIAVSENNGDHLIKTAQSSRFQPRSDKERIVLNLASLVVILINLGEQINRLISN